uniref:EGF-like domain-containing protein n=1 Tax=Strongyloides stercoralis TaxID=6248 RepID=A0AAF5D9C7_STRER
MNILLVLLFSTITLAQEKFISCIDIVKHKRCDNESWKANACHLCQSKCRFKKTNYCKKPEIEYVPGCDDYSDSCPSKKNYCFHIRTFQALLEDCPKTCGYCIKTKEEYDSSYMDDDVTIDEKKANSNKRKPFKYYVNNETINDIVKVTIEDIERYTCIKFSKQNKEITHGSGLIFNGKTGIMEYTDIKKKPIEFKITDDCGNQNSCYRRQIFHLLCFENFHKIRSKKSNNNNMKNLSKRSSEKYDFGSILFTKCDLGIEDPLDKYYKNMCGLKNKYSFNDFKLLNSLYCQNECSNDCLPCQNDGYQDPNSCDSCICPFGYKGRYCEDIYESDDECPKYNPLATKKRQTISVCGKHNCNFLLQAPKGYKIVTEIKYSASKYINPCYGSNGINFKYQDDKGKSGLNLCGFYENVTIPGYSNEVLVSYFGKKNAIALSFSYYVIFDKNECYTSFCSISIIG